MKCLKFQLQACLPDLPDGYTLSVPRLNLLSSPEVRQPGKAPNYSVNWALGYDNPEIIDAMKGKDQVNIVYYFVPQKCSVSESLQNFPYFWNTKTHIIVFFFISCYFIYFPK